MADLLDELFELEPTPTQNIDTQRGYRPTYERCPDCGHLSYALPWHHRTRSYKVLGVGWITTSACECGRYRWLSWYCGWLDGHLANGGVPLEIPPHWLEVPA